MNDAVKVTGDIQNIKAILAIVRNLTVSEGRVSFGVEIAEAKKVMTDLVAQNLLEFSSVKRQKNLCDAQLKIDAMGVREYSLGSNIYGWAVYCHMHSNITGGRASLTSRGASLERCLAFLAEATQRDGGTFSANLSKFPAEVQALFETEAASRSFSA